MDQEKLLKEIEDFKKQRGLSQNNTILDEIEQFKQQRRNQKAPVVAQAVYPETTEGKYLQPVYDVLDPALKAASLLEKPLSVSMAAGRSIGKGISGQENPMAPLKEELSSPFPTPAGSLTADFREAGIGSEGFLKDTLPEEVKAQFPKASAFVENVAPIDVVDMAASAKLGLEVPGMAGAKKLGMEAADSEFAKNALIRGSQRDVKFVGELQSSGKLDTLANKVLSDKALIKNISNPNKMVEYLQGVNREITDPITGQRKQVPIKKGKLNEVGERLSSSIKKFDKKLSERGQRLDVRNFTDDIVSEIMVDSEKIGSGQSFNPEKIKLEVEKYTKALDKSLENMDLNRRSFADLVELKRGAADRIFKMKQVGLADVDNPTFAEQVARKVWVKADDEINKIADSFQDYDVIKMNNEFSDYQKIRELYANKDVAQKYVPRLLEDLVPMAAIGLGTTAATGSPYMGAIAAGGYPMARSAVSSSALDFPARSLKIRTGIVEPAVGAISNANPMAIGAALAAYQVPRNTDRIIAESDKFIAKLLQNIKTPDDKILFDEVLNTIENKPDQLSSLMPILLTKYPNIFAPDKYNRINGQVDPMLKGKAIEDIVKSKSGSALERANKAEKLINDNILED